MAHLAVVIRPRARQHSCRPHGAILGMKGRSPGEELANVRPNKIPSSRWSERFGERPRVKHESVEPAFPLGLCEEMRYVTQSAGRSEFTGAQVAGTGSMELSTTWRRRWRI